MHESIKTALKIIWLLVLGYWLVSGMRIKKVEHQESFPKRFLQYWFPLLVAIALLGPGEWFGQSWLREKFVEHSNLVGYTGLFISLSGAIIACTSRYQLGKNWSLSVQRKQDHDLVRSGIYSTIRHPIYTGLLLLFAGNALIVGDYRAILAVAIVFLSLWSKLKKEERWLTETFGADYLNYREHSWALFPFLL